MTVTFNDSTNLQGIYQHLKWITGQDSLGIKDATRIINFALDDYSTIAIESSGKWKLDQSTNTTHPIATRTVTAGRQDYELDTTFLAIDRVELYVNGEWKILKQIDRRDRDKPLAEIYDSTGGAQYFDYDGSSIWLYPATSGTLKVYLSRPIEYFDITDTTVEIGIPRIHHEYVALKAAQKMHFRLSDSDYSRIEREVAKWEGTDGTSGGKLRDYFSKRDQTTSRRLKAKNSKAVK